ncbi:formate dehydrogenase [Hydrogenophaga sp. OTU3427]|uniref:formate dehydrogenase n=1 Tax=Hydrogenophaga sp. OTU3427 TaxID=3043856 RepID=UPI00313E994D
MRKPDPVQPRSLNRRSLFAGAGTLGAVAATATLLPAIPEPEAQAAPALPKPERGGGYSLTEHVKQYYKTTRV